MKTSFTPGPWHRNIKPASSYPIIFAGRNTHVAQVITRGLSIEEQEANTSLIASAPDLLEALRETERELSFSTLGAFNNLSRIKDSPAKAAIVAARAAIARATGKEL